VSKPQFDAARKQAGHEDLPTAASIARRLQAPWTEVLARAVAGGDQAGGWRVDAEVRS
jgi:hypothetical protein